MICPKCGKETDAGRTFCVWCGATYEVAPVSTVEEQPQVMAPQLIGGIPRKFFLGGVLVTIVIPVTLMAVTSIASQSIEIGFSYGLTSFITVVITMRVVSYMLKT